MGSSSPSSLRSAPLGSLGPCTLTPVQLAWRNQESLMPKIAGKPQLVPAIAAGAPSSPGWGWGGGLQLWKLPPAQLENGPPYQHQGHQEPVSRPEQGKVSRSWSVNSQERPFPESCVCAGRAHSSGTFLNAGTELQLTLGTARHLELRQVLGGQTWPGLDVGHCEPHLTCFPRPGPLQEVWAK